MDLANAPRAGRREWIGLAVLTLACLLYVMDLTVLHLAVPSISAELEPSSSQLLWIIDIYGFLIAGSLITMGTLGDRIGRRRLLLAGAAGFGAASVVAAFSNSAEMLIVARAMMGVAGATLGPSTLSLIFNMFPDPKQRATAIGVWMSAFSAGSAIGPVLGGILLQYFWWGSVFLLALPVMALLLVLGPRVLPEFSDPEAGRLDLLSAGMSLAAILAVIWGLKEVAQDGFTVPPILSVIAGLGVGALFLRRQTVLDDPLIDPRLFRIPSFTASLATNVLTIFVAVGYFLFVPQYLQLVLGLSPLQAGLWSVPSAVGFVIGSNLAPRFVHSLRPAYVIGTCLTLGALGLALLTQVGGGSGLAMVVVASVVISVALAPVFALTTELIVGSAPPQRAGSASGIAETASELGGSLGIAILGSIGMSVYRNQLSSYLPAEFPAEAAAEARNTLGEAIGVAAHLSGGMGTVLVDSARQAFLVAFETTASISVFVAVGTAVLAMILLRNVQAPAAPEPETTTDAVRAIAGASGVEEDSVFAEPLEKR